ncbi:MAG: substrate-binding domain-containing protein [Chthonomonadaceae bacterium]|nr:substrate-binding domain-containing protein [Chthonomonadaceae bacterium]
MRTCSLVFAVFAALALSGCGSKGDSAATTGNGAKTTTIAVIPKGSTHEFWKAVRAGAEEAGKELGVNVIFKGPIKEDDRESQIKVVEDFVAQGVQGIVLAPLDDQALRTPVMNAQKQDIPVVIIDSDLKDVETVSFVATDNRKGGEMAGAEMARLLGGKGRIVVLRYQEGSASTNNREEGFLDGIKAAPGIEVVSSNQFAGPTTETAQQAAENLLAAYKNADGSLSIDGIFTPNESSTFGMLRVLQDSGWAGKVKFIGFDSSAKLVEGLKEGQLNALVLQDPHRMGYLGVKVMLEYLNGAKPEKRIDTGAVLVTPENMTEDKIAKLLAPPQ